MTLHAAVAFSSIPNEVLRGHAATLVPASLIQLTDRLASALLGAAWESAVLVAAVALTLRLVPGLSAALRARLWLAVLALLVLLPALPVALPQALVHSADSAGLQPLRVSAVWSLWLACAWAVLSAARAVKLLAGAVRLRGVARAAVPVPAGAEHAALLQHRGRAVELCVSAEIGRPSVIGFLRPRILLPPALFEALSPAALRQVLLHEMEHLRRHDDWTNLAQKLALVVLPLDPALFWVERRLCAERELACDDGVLRQTAARKAYAACLVSLAEHAMLRRGAALALGAWERQTELARRVHRILRRPEPAMRPAAARLAVAGVLGGVLAGGALLAGCPQLVRFAPEPASTLAAVEAPESLPSVASGRAQAELAGFHPAPHSSAAMQSSLASPAYLTLATAVLPARQPAVAGGERPLRSVARKERAGTAARLTAAARSARPRDGIVALRRVSTLRTSVDRTATAAPRVVLLTVWQSAAPALTFREDAAATGAAGSAEEFPPSYAAVPMQGGWLLVQL